jgi:hypothetical protein
MSATLSWWSHDRWIVAILTLPISELWFVDLKDIDGTATVRGSENDVWINAYLAAYPTFVSKYEIVHVFPTYFCQFLITASVESMIVPLL